MHHGELPPTGQHGGVEVPNSCRGRQRLQVLLPAQASSESPEAEGQSDTLFIAQADQASSVASRHMKGAASNREPSNREPRWPKVKPGSGHGSHLAGTERLVCGHAGSADARGWATAGRDGHSRGRGGATADGAVAGKTTALSSSGSGRMCTRRCRSSCQPDAMGSCMLVLVFLDVCNLVLSRVRRAERWPPTAPSTGGTSDGGPACSPAATAPPAGALHHLKVRLACKANLANLAMCKVSHCMHTERSEPCATLTDSALHWFTTLHGWGPQRDARPHPSARAVTAAVKAGSISTTGVHFRTQRQQLSRR
jgi:hypothetical protein